MRVRGFPELEEARAQLGQRGAEVDLIRMLATLGACHDRGLCQDPRDAGQRERQEAGVDLLIHAEHAPGEELFHAQHRLQRFERFLDRPAMLLQVLELVGRKGFGIKQDMAQMRLSRLA